MDSITRNRILLILCSLGMLVVMIAGVTLVVSLFMEDSLTPAERAMVILKQAPLIDGKNDFPYNVRKFLANDLRKYNFSANISTLNWIKDKRPTQTDFFRMKSGMVGAQVWVARAECDSQYKDAVAITLEQIDLIKRLISNYSSSLSLVNNTKDIDRAIKAKKIGSIISIEGGQSIQSSLGVLRMYYELGVRMMTLVKDCSTPWADNSKVDHSLRAQRHLPYNQGLTPFGQVRQKLSCQCIIDDALMMHHNQTVIREMNRLGMMIDISHASEDAMKDILDKSKAPVVFSHAAARNICDSEHNLHDSIIKLVRQNKGIIMIAFDPQMITCGASNSTLHHVIEHINYIKSKASVDNIGIGSNFDGMSRAIKGLEDVSTYPKLFATLVEFGWDYEDLEKLAGKNFVRVFSQVEKVRDSLKGMDPVHANIDKNHVKRQWDKENCTSKLGFLPYDYYPGKDYLSSFLQIG